MGHRPDLPDPLVADVLSYAVLFTHLTPFLSENVVRSILLSMVNVSSIALKWSKWDFDRRQL